MGYDTILHLIDPAVFKDVGKRLDALALDDITGVKALFAERKKSFEEVEELYVEDENVDDPLDLARRVAFATLVSEKDWYFEGGHEYLVEGAVRAIPGLAPLQVLASRKGTVEPPPGLLAEPLGGGLECLWSGQDLDPALQALRQVRTKQEIHALVSKRTFTLFEKLFKVRARHNEFVRYWMDDEIGYWNEWQNLVEAVTAAVDSGFYLGIESN
jgi:hypothetical protein